ncbi:MAG: hypothetical protein HKN18_13255 [Silicimonas sp.]|nr:hypothetical protein [Silicimonas sp.]
MSKHIIDGPRTRVESERLEHYTRIDRQTSGKPSLQSAKLTRETRSRDPGEKLRRYTKLDRQN